MGGSRGESVPSAARFLKASEITDLVSIARALPEDWCVQVLPPHGQLSVVPIADRRTHHRIWTAAIRWGAIRRESGLV